MAGSVPNQTHLKEKSESKLKPFIPSCCCFLGGVQSTITSFRLILAIAITVDAFFLTISSCRYGWVSRNECFSSPIINAIKIVTINVTTNDSDDYNIITIINSKK